jgi:hypothetical protein
MDLNIILTISTPSGLHEQNIINEEAPEQTSCGELSSGRL